MIDWLRANPHQMPVLDVAGRPLPVIIRRLDRARRMTMRISPDGSEIRISIPRWVPTQEALAFAHSRTDWLTRQITESPSKNPVSAGTVLPFRGVPLTITHDLNASRTPTLTDSTLCLGGSPASINNRVYRWLRDQAFTTLSADLAYYCDRAEQPCPSLGLSTAQRRWGSCAHDGSIRINWRLMMAPDLVRRSVVAHEVAHLLHFDHSPAFHHFLKTIFEGSIHDANRWLKANGRTLYAPYG